jgi:hypothetical protein
MKTHDWSVVTLSLKNIVFGAPVKDPGFAFGKNRKEGTKTDKPIVHGGGFRGINYNLFDLAYRLHPHLAVIDPGVGTANGSSLVAGALCSCGGAIQGCSGAEAGSGTSGGFSRILFHAVWEEQSAAAHRQNMATAIALYGPDSGAALATVVGVVGSNGKTTTKEMIAHVLSGQGKVAWAKKSYNNFIGLPLTLFEVGP